MSSSGKKAMRGIRLRITGMTVLFTLVLSITFGSASFYFFRSYARSSVLRAAEFNLELVAHLVQQDLIELNSLASQQALNQELAEYLAADEPTRRQALDIYDTMTQMVGRSRSYTYLQRFLATDGEERFIQVSSSAANATPLNAYNISLLPGLDNVKESVWQQVFHDPLLPESVPDSLLVMQPVYRPRSNERIGTVYLTASTRGEPDHRFRGQPAVFDGGGEREQAAGIFRAWEKTGRGPAVWKNTAPGRASFEIF